MKRWNTRKHRPLMRTGAFPTQERGFTFLEVMIAVAILSIALVSLLHLVVLGIDYADYDKTLTLATLLAREKLAEGLVDNQVQKDAEGNGEEIYEMFSWQRTFTPTVFNHISQLKVNVTWLDNEEEKNVTLTQFVFHK